MENFNANNPHNVLDLFEAMNKKRQYYFLPYDDGDLTKFQLFCSDNEQTITQLIQKKNSTDERLLHLEIEFKYARWWQRSRIKNEIQTLEKFKFYDELNTKFSKHISQKYDQEIGDVNRKRRLEQLAKFNSEKQTCQCHCKCL